MVYPVAAVTTENSTNGSTLAGTFVILDLALDTQDEPGTVFTLEITTDILALDHAISRARDCHDVQLGGGTSPGVRPRAFYFQLWVGAS